MFSNIQKLAILPDFSFLGVENLNWDLSSFNPVSLKTISSHYYFKKFI